MQRFTDADANIIDVIAFPFITDLDEILKEFPEAEMLSVKISGSQLMKVFKR